MRIVSFSSRRWQLSSMTVCAGAQLVAQGRHSAITRVLARAPRWPSTNMRSRSSTSVTDAQPSRVRTDLRHVGPLVQLDGQPSAAEVDLPHVGGVGSGGGAAVCGRDGLGRRRCSQTTPRSRAPLIQWIWRMVESASPRQTWRLGARRLGNWRGRPASRVWRHALIATVLLIRAVLKSRPTISVLDTGATRRKRSPRSARRVGSMQRPEKRPDVLADLVLIAPSW
jgi:hypothetical protein